MKPEIISTREICKGGIFTVVRDTIREENITYERDIVAHHGSAVVVPVFADRTIALVRQYRHAAGKYLLELCAGSLEKGENPEAGARRELEEEIGVRAAKMEKLTEFYVSPGFLSEKMFVFLATELTETGQKLEEDELLSIERVTFPQAFEMIRRGEFEDAKTIAGLILAGSKLSFYFG